LTAEPFRDHPGVAGRWRIACSYLASTANWLASIVPEFLMVTVVGGPGGAWRKVKATGLVANPTC